MIAIRSTFALTTFALGLAACRPAPTTPPPAAPTPAAPPSALQELVHEQEIVVPGDPGAVYDAFTGDVSLWWDHTFSEEPAGLAIDPRPGGGFVEQFDDAGNGALHATVIYADRGKRLRMTGPLGLSGTPVEMVHTFDFEAVDGGKTRVKLRLHAIGPLPPDVVEAVKGVWHHFLVEQFQAYMESRGSTGTAGAEASLLRQPPHTNADHVGLGFFSHRGKGSRRNHVHADDFRLGSDAVVTHVRWWGLSDQPRDLGNFDDFQVTIRAADRSGAPGKVLVQQRVPTPATSPRATGRRGSGKAPASRGPEYVQLIELEKPATLQAGATYFLTVAAHRIDPEADNWQWQDAAPDNRVSFSHPLGQPKWQRIEDADSAFELLGRPAG